MSGRDYRSCGVDIDEGEAAVERMKASVRRTYGPRVLSDLGSFGGLFRADFPGIARPVLVASTDGVGTKLRVASMTGRYGTVGADLVNHCVNDILVQGAVPLFFLDYIACGKLDAGVAATIVDGMASACTACGCALLGGETAEMPGFYAPGDYDVAGTIVGVVGESSIVDGTGIAPGMRIIGLESSGLHTNGYSLARKVLFELAGLSPDSRPGILGGATVADALLEVHRCYLDAVRPVLEEGLARGLCHVTGGGVPGNLKRILPRGCGAIIEESWPVPPLFTLIEDLGGIARREMRRVFNMGAGFLVVVDCDSEARCLDLLANAGGRPFPAGCTVAGDGIAYSGKEP